MGGGVINGSCKWIKWNAWRSERQLTDKQINWKNTTKYDIIEEKGGSLEEWTKGYFGGGMALGPCESKISEIP